MDVEKREEYDEIFTHAYRTYYRIINRFLNGIVYDSAVAEELCQDVFLKVWERNARLDPGSGKTLNFLFTIAKNAGIDYLRRKKIEDSRLRQVCLDEAAMDRAFYDSIENSYIRGEVISTLGDIINSFPEREKEVLVEKILHERRSSEISREKKISVYRIRQIEEEAQGRIREMMGDYFRAAG